MEKQYEIGMIIAEIINDAMNDEDSQYRDVLRKAMLEDTTLFVHAIGNVAPMIIYEGITREKKDLLAFNHKMNRLILQYSVGTTDG